MAKVNNSTAQNKWDSLKGSAGVSLSHIVQGKASSSDFQRVQNILNQQSSLASQVFKQATSAAEAQAKKFQASYQAVLDKDNKELLSAFEVAMNAELQKVMPDLVGQLKEIIEMSNASANEELDKSIGTKFEAFKEFLPKEKDVPSMHDILEANARQAAEIHSDAQVRWERQEPALLEKIAGVFQSTLRNLAETINREKAAREGPTSVAGIPVNPDGSRMLPNPDGHGPLLLGGPEAAHKSVLDQGMSLLHGEHGSDVQDVEARESGGHAGGSSTTVVALNQSVHNELTTAAKAQTDFYDRVKALLPGDGKSGGKGQAEDEENEEKTANTWWRSFKNWFGDDDKKKKKNKDKFSWLKDLGSLLALMILNPKLFKDLADGVKKLLTWDNLKAAAEKSWEWVKDVSSGVMEVIANLLGGTMKTPTQADATKAKAGGKDLATTKNKPGDTKHADLNNLTPEQQKQMAAMDKANHADSSGPGWINSGLSMLGVTTPAMKNYNLSHTDTNKNSPTYGHIVIGGVDKGKNPDFTPTASQPAQTPTTTAAQSAGSARSSVTPTTPAASGSPSSGSGGSSTVSAAPSVPYTPGVSLPPPTESTPAGGSAATQPQKGSPQIGIGSFGFTAANSDSLNIMNTGHFTGS
jgi:hypothetical protein